VLDKVAKVKFVEPYRRGFVPVEHCIHWRRSVRGFRDRKLTKDELGQLLWAAQGITAPDGRPAVSSAGTLYPLELYIACGDVSGLASDVCRYIPKHHELLLVIAGHQREKLVHAALGQEWIASAAAVCIAAAFERTTVRYGNRARGYVYMEARLAGESLMLQAVALGLATTVVWAFGDDDLKHLLHPAPNETSLCLLPVGAP